MVRETSAGGVVLRKMRGRWYVAVIEPHMERPRKNIKIRKANRTPADAELIALPKGSIDPGEKPEETALREIREETGVRADMVAKLADIKYIYVRNWGDRAKVFKIVSFYLLTLSLRTPRQHRSRHADRGPERFLASPAGGDGAVKLQGRTRGCRARHRIPENPS